jgi:hypothetical protein
MKMERIVYMMIEMQAVEGRRKRAKWDRRNLGFPDVSVAGPAGHGKAQGTRHQATVQCFVCCISDFRCDQTRSRQLYNCWPYQFFFSSVHSLLEKNKKMKKKR